MSKSSDKNLRFVRGDYKPVKDLSEQLGKIPPQAIDLEEAILGALMLEKSAITAVVEVLKPDHFYKETHQEIYAAILDLFKASEPIDMRTVRHKLTQKGKTEFPEGPPHFVVAELTSKVSSAANIEYHARVVLEMSAKRSLIHIASKIHQDAYDLDADIFKLIDSTRESVDAIEKTSLSIGAGSKVMSLWDETLVTEKPADDEVLIYVNNTPVLTTNNHILILGKKKSRKTFFVIMMISQSLMSGTIKPEDVMFFDTEQAKSDVWLMREAIRRLTGHVIPIFYLRGRTPVERREFIEATLNLWQKSGRGTKRPSVAVIDGIRDCMSNINDPDETTEVISWLEKMTLSGTAIINILHLNKTDGNARGHIGTELLNKAWMTIEIELDTKTGHSVVKVESSRKKPFEPYAFTHGKDELPTVVDMPSNKGELSEAEQRRRVIQIFEGDRQIRYGDLAQEIKDYFSDGGKRFGINKAQNLIMDFQRRGWIVKIGKEGTRQSAYKCIINAESVPPQGDFKSPPSPEPYPVDLFMPIMEIVPISPEHLEKMALEKQNEQLGIFAEPETPEPGPEEPTNPLDLPDDL